MSDATSTTATAGGPPHPLRALYERIDYVRGVRKDLPIQLRNIAAEVPSRRTSKTLGRLADALDENVPAAKLVAQFQEHCWLLTLQSSAATTDALTAMLEQTAFRHRIQAKKVRAIAYPMVLLSVASVILLGALVVLIPPFDQMFAEFSLRLPAPTRLLISASRLVTGSPLLAVGIVVAMLIAIALLLWIWISDSPIKQRLLGPSLSLSRLRQSLVTVCLQVADLCDEGLTLDHALKITAESNTNVTMRSLLGDLATQAALDPSKLPSTRAAMVLPPNVLFALRPNAGTQGSAVSPPNTSMLRALADSYRELSIRRNEWISFLLAQVTIIGVGLMIGFAVVALFMPLVSLVSSLSG